MHSFVCSFVHLFEIEAQSWPSLFFRPSHSITSHCARLRSTSNLSGLAMCVNQEHFLDLHRVASALVGMLCAEFLPFFSEGVLLRLPLFL